jgi:hypothetical protein
MIGQKLVKNISHFLFCQFGTFTLLPTWRHIWMLSLAISVPESVSLFGNRVPIIIEKCAQE